MTREEKEEHGQSTSGIHEEINVSLPCGPL